MTNKVYHTQKETKEFKKRMAVKKQQSDYEMELNERIKTNEILSSMQLFEGIRLKRQQEELLNKKIEIKNKLIGKLPYKEFIILYDIFNCSYYEIKNSLIKNKITMDNVNKVIDTINNIYPILNKKDVLEYIN